MNIENKARLVGFSIVLVFLLATSEACNAVLPSSSSAKFEEVTGNPSGYPESVTADYAANNPPTPISNVMIKIKYPIEMSQGETVKLLVTCINNSYQPIGNLRVVVWGKPYAMYGSDANYFDGINVSTTDPQFIGSGIQQSDGLFAYFDTGVINPGETKAASINIAALTIGGYRAEIDADPDIPGITLASYQVKFLTTVK